MAKTSTPKGFRDFNPLETSRRSYIFKTIESVFQLYGYQAIETPAMENLSTLTGKYGAEGDKLLFKVLNSGDYLEKLSAEEIASKQSNKLTSKIAEKGLRYDLTVPFARYVVEHQNDITFPFKRYQIQPVWRADRPQKGRYREFYQCDVDVIGSDSLLNEVELIQIIHDVFKKLGISVTIKINNRKFLLGLAKHFGIDTNFIDFTVALDKIDKIGISGCESELKSKGLNVDFEGDVFKIFPYDPRSNLSGFDQSMHQLDHYEELFKNNSNQTGIDGCNEIREILSKIDLLDLRNSNITFDFTLARGLNYYTGAIIEVISNDVQIGSICGGGRYDDLTGIFGLPDVSGVGISFGADRIYDVLNELGLFNSDQESGTQLLFINFGEKETEHCLPLLQAVRKAGIRSELYPDNAKMKKQMSYADKLNIPFVVMIGEDEIKNRLYSLKNMKSGEQQKLDIEGIIKAINT